MQFSQKIRVTPAFSPEPLSVYRGTVEIPIRLESQKQSPGPVILRLDFQPCDNRSCRTPQSMELPPYRTNTTWYKLFDKDDG